MGVKFIMDGGDKVGPQFKAKVLAFSEKQKTALNQATRKAADQIEYQGRANIGAGGNFKSTRWQGGFRAVVSFTKEGARIRVTHAVSYWRVFEYGARILGKPLLWIPLSFGNARQGTRAKDYPGQLFRVDRPGKAPLLLDKNGPQYFGKESVTIPKKWDLRGIVRTVARQMNQFYREAMRSGK